MLVNNSNLTTIWIDANDQQINIIDQRYLPHKLSIVKLNSVKDVEFAIREMQVRGAPLIGVTAAFGMYLAALEDSSTEFLDKAADFLIKARPTAVNLSWAVKKIKLTAVGLDFIKKSAASLRNCIEEFSKAARYIPNAAVTPISGAPLTCISLMANSTSFTVLNVTMLSS